MHRPGSTAVRLVHLVALTLLVAANRSSSPALPVARAQETAVAAASPGAPSVFPLSGGEHRRHPLAFHSAEYVSLLIEPEGIEVGVSLKPPNGSVLVDVVYRDREPLRIAFVTEASGPYQLEVRALDAAELTGRYAVTVEERRPARPADTHRAQAARLCIEAGVLQSGWTLDRTRAAIEKYRAAQAAWRAAGDAAGEARAARRISELDLVLAYPDRALAAALTARRLSVAAADEEGARRAALTAARVYLHLGDIENAGTSAREALQSGRAAHDGVAVAEALNVLGAVAEGSWPLEARERYTEALSLSQERHDRRGQAQALKNLGYAETALDDFEDAKRSFEAALALWKAVVHDGGQADTLIGLGHLQAAAGHYQEALARYAEAGRLCERMGQRVGLARVETGLGFVNLRLGEPEAAVAHYRRAIDLFQEVEDPQGQASSVVALATSLAAAGHRGQAIQHLRHGLELTRAVSDHRATARALELLGHEYVEAGQLDLALRHFEEALSLARQVNFPLAQIYALDGIGQVLQRRGRHEEALEQFAEVVRLSHELHPLAESAARYQAARIEAERGRADVALAGVRESLEIVEALRSDVASLDFRASLLASVRDRYELEIDLMMQLHERDRSAGFDVKAFEAGERARARTLLDSLAEARQGIRAGIDPALRDEERLRHASLSAAARRLLDVADDAAHREERSARMRAIDERTAAYREVEARIRKESPRYSALTQPPNLTLAEIQTQVLEHDSVLLQYFVGARHSYLWVVTREGMAGFVLPGREVVESRARAFRKALQAANASSGRAPKARSYVDLATELSRLLLGPAAAQLGRRRLVVVADGELQSLPFAALPDPCPSHPASEPAVPLVVDHEIVYLPSASTLPLLRNDWHGARQWSKSAIVIADPVFEWDDPRIKHRPPPASVARSGRRPPAGGRRTVSRGAERRTSLPRLAETGLEANAIADLGPPDTKLALGFDANRDLVTSGRLSGYRVVHFATHGIVDEHRPELSSLVLSLFDAEGRPQDGFVRLTDIYNLEMPADLVVLSACDTALGKTVAGEGLIGLVRGFMYAGTGRVVATLWRTDDEATHEFMVRFYRGLFQEKLGPAAALRRAQMDLLASPRWHDPFYWAGFVLQGDWY